MDRARRRWWPFRRRAEQLQTVPVVEEQRITPVVDERPAEADIAAVHEPEGPQERQAEPAAPTPNELPDVAAEAADDEVPPLSDDLGLSDERRRELSESAARSAMRPPNPAPVDVDDSLAASRAALEAAQWRASAWACEITGARPLSVERRRKLLAFYLTSLAGEPETNALLQRIVDEDPDLRPIAVAALAESAA
jgi:hypothetical protein